MLGYWQPHADYQQQVVDRLSIVANTNPYALKEYEKSISKLYILDLDTIKQIIAPLYSTIGRASENQPGIFRSFVLMVDRGYPLNKWIVKLSQNPVLRIACGFQGKLPGVASYYDFINRIIKLDEISRTRPKKIKPTKDYGKNKMPPKHAGIVQKLVDRILLGRRFNLRPERHLQEIFAKGCVQQSIDLGLVPLKVSLSGDGTCIETGASIFGRKTCECRDFNCDCPRRYSDPNATWGWDSHEKRYFYGYTGYFISTYNRTEKIDLPLSIRLVDAKRHDSNSAVVSLAELRDLFPNLTIENFISDSASDNYPTYQLLNEWNINAVIALNKTSKGNKKYPDCTVNKDGVPVCPAGQLMVLDSLRSRDRCRIKWRCPRVLGKCEHSEACDKCSPSPYGRVFHTKPVWDLRLFTNVPRGSKRFKEIMKERTAAERVNNRILNDYGLKKTKVRGKKRISFIATLAAFNIHLDAQFAKLKAIGAFDFSALFGLRAVA